MNRRRLNSPVAAIVGLLTLASACASQPVAPALAPLARPESLGELNFSMLPEASGMAISYRTAKRLWMINDQGNPADLIAVDLPDGDRVETSYARVDVRDASNGDWEDLDSFSLNGESWIVVADIGDNLARRDTIALWFVPEPAANDKRTAVARKLTLIYPDGARDAESMAVDARGNAIYILSKRDSEPRLYQLPLDEALRV
ncbi:MAG: hypothetical protein AAGA84_06865, partial [Pseudomonadota bacterium]